MRGQRVEMLAVGESDAEKVESGLEAGTLSLECLVSSSSVFANGGRQLDRIKQWGGVSTDDGPRLVFSDFLGYGDR